MAVAGTPSAIAICYPARDAPCLSDRNLPSSGRSNVHVATRVSVNLAPMARQVSRRRLCPLRSGECPVDVFAP